jgi:hypothetical protein
MKTTHVLYKKTPFLSSLVKLHKAGKFGQLRIHKTFAKLFLNLTAVALAADSYSEPCYLYECVLALKALLLQKSAPNKYKQLMSMQVSMFKGAIPRE